MRIDLSKNAADNVFALLRQTLNSPFVTDQTVQLGAPAAYAGQGGRNTKIMVSAIPGMGMFGTNREFYYRRLGLRERVPAAPTSISVNETTTAEGLRARLVELLELREEEILPIAALTGNPSNVSLQAKSGSLLYLETPVVFTLNWFVRALLSSIGTDIWFLSNTPFTPQLVVDKLVADYDVDLTLADLLPFTIPDMSAGGVFDIALTAHPDSASWQGSTTVSLLLGDGDRLHTHLHTTMAGWFA